MSGSSPRSRRARCRFSPRVSSRSCRPTSRRSSGSRRASSRAPVCDVCSSQPAVHRQLLGHLHPPRLGRDGDRRGPDREQGDPRSGRSRPDRRPRCAVRALGVDAGARTRVARRAADSPGRARRAGGAGAALSIAWTPCSGPTLAAILAAAGTTRSEGHGALLLAFYSAGLAIPFIATSSPSIA